ncbi:MAG: phosphoenolpyruvate-utilizing N-terminal domain-containing protein, partial [Mariprofundus sp.]|nr:phosphoenolpyruvate-utilizing N-terminal domain-containing protein [Mariprofundus sp.]
MNQIGCRASQRTVVRREGHAVASSADIVIGRVRKLLHGYQPVPERAVDHAMIEQEIIRLLEAIDAAVQSIDIERKHLLDTESREPLMILDSHRMLIVDPDLLDKSSARIRDNCINAEWALRQELDAIQLMFSQIDDEYLRNRNVDIEHAGRRILDHLMGESTKSNGASLSKRNDKEPLIYVGDDFSVSDVVNLWRRGVAGIITE